jgi:hypothetical protein
VHVVKGPVAACPLSSGLSIADNAIAAIAGALAMRDECASCTIGCGVENAGTEGRILE